MTEAQIVTTTFTTLSDAQTEWQHSGLLFVRRVQEKNILPISERNKAKAQIPYLEDHQKTDWLANIVNYGKHPILLTYKVSENTLVESPLFGAVLAKETLHHTKTSADMKRIFDDPLDQQLRKDWKHKAPNCPVFIKLWDSYPEVYEFLKTQCDGKLVKLHYAAKTLTISVPDLEQIFTLNVETIKN